MLIMYNNWPERERKINRAKTRHAIKKWLGYFLIFVGFYVWLWKPPIVCDYYTGDPYIWYQDVDRAYRFERLANQIRETAAMGVGSDVSAFYLINRESLTLVAGDDESDRVRGVLDSQQQLYYDLAKDKGCVPINFRAIVGPWAKTYLDAGINHAVLCSIRSRVGQMRGALAFGYFGDDPPNFDEVFQTVAPYRKELNELALKEANGVY